MINTNRWDHLVSLGMQKEVKCCEMDRKRVSERFGNSADCLEISAEGSRQYMSTRLRGGTEGVLFYSLEEMGKQAWEEATGIKVLNYLESSNIAGTEASTFQRYQNRQHIVFQRFLEDHDAFENMHPEAREELGVMLKDITRAMDEYGAGGYRGISRKSMLLSQNMIAQLEYFNANYVPAHLQGDFQNLIEECDYFNQKSRERMFADTMPCDILLEGLGEGLVNKEQSAVVQNYLEYSRREKDEISRAFSSLRGKSNSSEIYAALQDIEKRCGRYDMNADIKKIFFNIKTSWKAVLSGINRNEVGRMF